MLRDPSTKYRRFEQVFLPERKWPSRRITAPPVWCSTDLRDGNQALFEPMNRATKLRLFAQLVQTGFKEIEVGFPSASLTDFSVMRSLIAEGLIPHDVTPMVITQARESLIERTVESLKGAKRAIIHVYNATAPAWRRIVFDMTTAEVMQLIDKHVRLIRELTDRQAETEWVLEYSPETFCMTELEVSLEACHTAMNAWNAGPDRRIILNLPTTVENATPNVFADQIEWMHERLHDREHVVLSVHPHNDRGTGVAAAELAILAGAQRVEGCLFGNGERSGNVDLVTLALNLYTQGIDPGLDFADINALARSIEDATKLPIHPRHPYVGDLVFTAFSGSHQDAIRKGMAQQKSEAFWEVPYLPIDPADLGRTYDSVIRVNSQSGKGGIAYLLERDYGLMLPRRMQVEFSRVVQQQMDALEAEMTSVQLWALFESTYLTRSQLIVYRAHRLFDSQGGCTIELDLDVAGQVKTVQGAGTHAVAATVNALGIPLRIDSCERRAALPGRDECSVVLIEAAFRSAPEAVFGAGRHRDTDAAAVLAILSATHRLGAMMHVSALNLSS